MEAKIRAPKVRARARRKKSIRKTLKGTSERPRLSVFRSNKHIYAQVVNDETGQVLVSVSTLSKSVREGLDAANKTAAAKKVGTYAAELCKEKNIEKIVFDRNGYLYTGRVSALASAAREAGLVF